MNFGLKFDGKVGNEMAFMEPVVYFGEFLMVDCSEGIIYVDSEYVNKDEVHHVQRLLEEGEKVTVGDLSFSDFVGLSSNEIFEIDIIDGWGCYMSAPGYLDRTDLTVVGTEAEAWELLEEYYGYDPNEDEESEEW